MSEPDTSIKQRILSEGRELSQAQLLENVSRAAAGFSAMGIGPEDTVAIMPRNDFPFFEASMAANFVGAHAVPINWHFQADEAGYIMRDCAVFGIPDEEYGEALCAFVEPEPGVALTVDGVREFLAARLAHYKTPKLIEFSHELPREDSGKIFKRKLRAPYWEKAGRQI